LVSAIPASQLEGVDPQTMGGTCRREQSKIIGEEARPLSPKTVEVGILYSKILSGGGGFRM